MSALKDFDAARSERKRKLGNPDQVVAFRIGGQEFRCQPVLPYGLVLDIALVPDDAPQTMQVAALDNLIFQMLKPECHDAWHAIVRDTENGLDLEDVRTIVQWMMEVYTGRPTEPSSTSAEQSSEAGRSSKD